MKPQDFSGARITVITAPRLTPILIFICLSLALTSGAILTGCSSKKSAFSGKGSPLYTGSNPIPKGGGRYKIGSPYKIVDKWYTPKENPNYDSTGTASWYGPKFHKRMTANGEWFDMNQMTAAHPTLPLPVFARVTNLKNGRSIIVRVNDRGPYAHNREIDLSRAAAQKLDFIKQGTAQVRVQYLSKAPLGAHAQNYYTPGQNATRYAKGNMNRPSNVSTIAVRQSVPRRVRVASNNYGPQQQLGSYPGTQNVQPLSTPVKPIYIQAASYSNINNAMRAKSNLAAIGNVEMTHIEIGQRTYYRLRVGPIRNPHTVQQTLNQIVDIGHTDAHIINN